MSVEINSAEFFGIEPGTPEYEAFEAAEVNEGVNMSAADFDAPVVPLDMYSGVKKVRAMGIPVRITSSITDAVREH